jgi:hypothetical protein
MTVNRTKSPKPAPLHEIFIETHTVNRYLVRGRTYKIPAVSVEHARKLGVVEVHKVAGCPPWRPLIRRSMEYTTAKLVTGDLPAAKPEQGDLFQIDCAA